MSRQRRLWLGWLTLLCVGGTGLRAADVPAEHLEFFERRVRPVLVEHCYGCHSAQAGKTKGGLALDTRAGWLRGGQSGPVLVAGRPDASLLIRAVRYGDPELQMPPNGRRLEASAVADLEAWVTLGAPDPRADTPSALPVRSAVDEARAQHWAFQPVTTPPVPEVRNARWVQTPVDAFVLARLEAAGLAPAPPADRRTLLRRLSYDLTGLPPTPAEVAAFVADDSATAADLVIDRLLASPRLGERWGRHWLDLARYADTKGYLAGGEERRFAFAHTYRDYVIRAFNEDKPYDRFLLEQIAADRLERGDDQRTLAALGFLTLGRRFLNNPHDIIDDRIDVVLRGTQALTVSCARCHDHKFDPISMADYYALHGVFASSEEPAEKPLLGPLEPSPAYDDYLRECARIEAEIETFKNAEVAKFADELRQQVGEYLRGARDAAALDDPAKFETWAGERKLNPTILRRWMAYLAARRAAPDPIFAPWFALAALPETDFAPPAAEALARLLAPTDGEPDGAAGRLNPVVTQAFRKPPESIEAAAQVYTTLFRELDAAWKQTIEAASKAQQPPPAAFPEADRERLRQVLYAEGSPVILPREEARTLLARRLGEGSAPLRNQIEALSWTHPGAPARAMALVDRARPHNSRLLLRGNPGNPGPEVPRRFLEVLGGAASASFTNGSGRLELARAIANPTNPLTARVQVNRVWMQLFGQGLVRTPGDFGVRTEPPVQRELLDYLAARFMAEGWSTKRLLRLILRSAIYQQASRAEVASAARDPENLLLHRQTRRRLDFEALRDTLLAVSGRLDLTMGGLPVDIVREPFPPRRTVYAFIERQNLPGVFRTFDFANPDVSSARRFQTTVPQQALFLMNSPFVLELARALAHREDLGPTAEPERRLQAMHRLTLQREADPVETETIRRFLAGPGQPVAGTGAGEFDPWEQYAQVLLLSNELAFVD